MSTNALILSGGGARAAYQVGVLRAVADILPKLHNPFPIICGTSAGAINATAMAAHPGEFRTAAIDLADTWRSLEIDNVFKTGWVPLLKGTTSIAASLFNQGVGQKKPLSLLDNSPLRELLNSILPLDNIDRRIEKRELEALCITAMGYSTGESVSFFQGNPSLRGWRRFRRVGTPAKISVEHLLASSAIPAIFPAVPLNKEYFGDGAMRQMAPISPALHLGADRIFVIGVSGNRNPLHWSNRKKIPIKHSPSMAQIIGQMFSSAFIDSLEGDIEHLGRTNQLLNMLNDEQQQEAAHLRPVETLIISPTKQLDQIAGRKVRNLSPSLRFMMRCTGATRRGGGATTASYLMFNHEYCHELIELGYQDAMWERDAIEKFFLMD
ncbi:patatin-like phospholipase family protein [Teredinibacter sp. KSP-S5-2]|uniref:patatin-like phospholipase family protein n=1 Tax=Teredinibacter sp. KSP-S5-2 TaxID=3034506 RepID=UPI00293424A6|nr:patatin-like phospholipase family protein [Teredinibacter sp. KSP-S5-2]WNO07676.1 patatin-like phospholipase family protein [Teredinibacter sp. KSP-S5-2]